MKEIFRIVKSIILKTFTTPKLQAKFLGVKLGKNCFIATRNWPTEPYLITIGNNVQLTKNVFIHTHGGAHVARKVNPKFDVFGKVTIKDWSYIGAGSHIMPGVVIGENVLIAAGSVVTKSVPDGEVWGGNPARFICSTKEYIQKNLKFNLDTKELNRSEKKGYLLSLTYNKFLAK